VPAEVKVLVSEIAAIPTSEATALEVAKNIFAKVYQGASSRLHITAYCAALEVLKETAVRRLPVELTAWFAQLPEDGKFLKDVGEYREGGAEGVGPCCVCFAGES
jgi:hypothetical protein